MDLSQCETIPNLATYPATRRQGRIAFAVCVFLVGVSLLAGTIANVPARVFPGFLPIVASACTMAALLTAYLLYSQFYATGVPLLAAAASAYGVLGLLTVPHMLAFPGVLLANGIGRQTSVWLWTAWHAAFPALIAVWIIANRRSPPTAIPQSQREKVIRLWVFSLVGICIPLGAFLFLFSAALPELITSDGKVQPIFAHVIVPAISVGTLATCALILWRVRASTVLTIWMVVALFADALDITLSAFSSSRFTIGWYVAKTESLFAASIVFTMLFEKIGTMYRSVATLASTDELTGLANRRTGLDQLAWLIDYSARTLEPLAVFMIDVDYFKLYNDRYGHVAGDVCLKAVSGAMRDQGRAADVFARYGGEEFFAVLPGVTLEGAELLAERVRGAVEALALPHERSSYGCVTVSIGIAQTGCASLISPEDLLRAADSALYLAKATGRNRIASRPCLAAEPVGPGDRADRGALSAGGRGVRALPG